MVYTFDLSNKVVILTGGYGYLGRAIAESLLFHGATVYILGRNKEKFLNTFSEYSGTNLFFQFCEISDNASILNAIESVLSQVKAIDVLINNAFYTQGQSPINMTDEEWAKSMEGTLGSVFKFIRGVIPHFLKNRSGKIINVASMYGMVSPDFSIYDENPQFLNPPHYGAAKAGIIQLTKYYANYLGGYGITVNSVTPGPFPSEDVQKQTSFIYDLSKRTSLNRIGSSEEVAGAFIYLASNASNFVTGQNIIVDGGWTSK